MIMNLKYGFKCKFHVILTCNPKLIRTRLYRSLIRDQYEMQMILKLISFKGQVVRCKWLYFLIPTLLNSYDQLNKTT